MTLEKAPPVKSRRYCIEWDWRTEGHPHRYHLVVMVEDTPWTYCGAPAWKVGPECSEELILTSQVDIPVCDGCASKQDEIRQRRFEQETGYRPKTPKQILAYAASSTTTSDANPSANSGLTPTSTR